MTYRMEQNTVIPITATTHVRFHGGFAAGE